MRAGAGAVLGILRAHLLYPLAELLQGRSIRSKLRALRADLALPPEERAAAARLRLARILALAGERVPYYRELFSRIGFDPRQAAGDPACLAGMPLLSKDILMEQPRRMLAEGLDPATLAERRTNGSTGPALPVWYSREALDWTAAANLLVLEWTGHRRSQVEAHLSSRFPETFPLRDRLREFVKCQAMNRVNLPGDAFDPEALDDLWHRLERARPHLVQGHPSTLYALACHLEASGRSGQKAFAVFESTGETLDAARRGRIAAVFGCRIFDRYGDAEFGVVAHEEAPEDARGMRVLDSVVWPETVRDASGADEIVLTGLTNEAMPLIRYRTGDLGILERSGDGLYLRQLQGRVHDVVEIGGRRCPTHYIQDLLNRLDGILEFQLEERPGAPVLLRLVARPDADRPGIVARLHSWWADAVAPEFTGFEGLRRCGAEGKFRHLVPRVPAPPPEPDAGSRPT